jgi:hypothetical protein
MVVPYQLSGRNGGQELVKTRQVKVLLGPPDESLQVVLVNRADGILAQNA